MDNQGNAGRSNQPGQGPPGQPPGQASPPYGQPPGGAYGPPPGGPPPYQPPYPAPPQALPGGTPYGAPPPPYGQPPAYGAPPYGQQPQPGVPYGQPYAQPAPPRKKKRTWLLVLGIVLGVIVLGIVGIAVWYSSLTTTISSIEFAHDFSVPDKKAVSVATTFSATDPTIFCVVRLNVNKESPTVKLVWTAVDVVNSAKVRVTDQQVATQTLDTSHESIIYGSIKRTGPAFAVGKYKVDVYFNDELKKTAEFTVTA